MPYGITWYKIFVASVIIPLLVSFDEVLFGSNGFLGDFSLIATLIAIAYIIGSFVLWIALTIESIVLLDFLTPLTTLISIFMMFIGIVGGSLTDFIFDLIKFPFNAIANLMTTVGLQSRFWFGAEFGIGGYIGFDVPTMTFMMAIKGEIAGTGAWVTSAVSILGWDGGRYLKSNFSWNSLGALGIDIRLRMTAVA